MKPTHPKSSVRSDRGEVASWLILAAGLALAASLAAGSLGDLIASLTSNIESAAATGEVATGPGAATPTTGDEETGAEDGEPQDPNEGASNDPEEGNDPEEDNEPEEDDGPEEDDEPEEDEPEDDESDDPPPPAVPDCFDPTDSTTAFTCTPPCDNDLSFQPNACFTETGCVQTFQNVCHDDGTCSSFATLGCSQVPIAHLLQHQADRYEKCSSATPNIIICNSDYVRGFEPGIRVLLEGEIGAHPGQLFELAAQVCDQGHPGCEFVSTFANWYHDNRALVSAAIIAGDIIPGPRGTVCLTSTLDGSFSTGDFAECALSLSTGVSVPFPSGVIDDALEGG